MEVFATMKCHWDSPLDTLYKLQTNIIYKQPLHYISHTKYTVELKQQLHRPSIVFSFHFTSDRCGNLQWYHRVVIITVHFVIEWGKTCPSSKMGTNVFIQNSIKFTTFSLSNPLNNRPYQYLFHLIYQNGAGIWCRTFRLGLYLTKQTSNITSLASHHQPQQPNSQVTPKVERLAEHYSITQPNCDVKILTKGPIKWLLIWSVWWLWWGTCCNIMCRVPHVYSIECDL